MGKAKLERREGEGRSDQVKGKWGETDKTERELFPLL